MRVHKTNTICPCGSPVDVSLSGGWGKQAWRAYCSNCIDASVDDAGAGAAIQGLGATAGEALADWMGAIRGEEVE